MNYIPFTYETDANLDCVIYTFAGGIKLLAKCVGGIGSVEFPPSNGVGAISFPIRHSGDVFQALRKASPIPQHCKAW